MTSGGCNGDEQSILDCPHRFGECQESRSSRHTIAHVACSNRTISEGIYLGYLYAVFLTL